MKSRTLLVLAVVTLSAAAAALYSRNAREQRVAASDSRSGELLFPALRERVNDVATLAVVSADSRFEVERTGQGPDAAWGASEKGGYPVDFQKVRGIVMGIANLAILEAKTADPERLPRLGLQDPTAPAASSKRVILRDRKGDVLADVIFGGDVEGARPSGKPSQYVRRSNENQSWEVAGRLQVDERLANWLDKQIVKLERTRVREVEVLHPDGERLVVERPSADVQDFQVRDLPADAKLSWAGVAGSVASSLEYLNLEDVRPASEVDLAGVEPTRSHFRAFDGLVVTTELYAKDELHYLTIRAAFDPDARQEEPPAPEPEEGEEPAAAPVSTHRPVEEVQQEAERIQERVAPWVYVIPGWAATNLQKRVGDLLAKPPAEGMHEGEDSALDGFDGLDIEALLRDMQKQEGHEHPEGEGHPEETGSPAPEEPEAPAEKPDEKPAEEPAVTPPGGGR